jgi:glycine oxidase
VTRPDAVVIGAGVVGCAVAWRAAGAGLRVLVVDRATPGAEASRAAAGMLSPLAEASGPGPMLDLLLHARAGFPDVVARLREATGVDAAYADAGTLVVALTEEDERELAARRAWQVAAGLPVERLEAAEARAMEPALSTEVRMALRYPGDHQVDNRSLSAALWAAAARAGAEFRIGAEVAGVVVEGGRAAGVTCAGGERIDAAAVVVAGGCWSGRLAGLPRALPVEPVHGQLLSLEAVPPIFRHVVDSPRCYLVPRADGRVIVGATVERTGFRKAVTPAGVMRLLRGALEVAPVLADAPLLATWSGLRPGTPDGLPILGADPDVPNLLYATGHYRNGILLAPLTGELIADLLLGREPTLDLQPFSIGRF